MNKCPCCSSAAKRAGADRFALAAFDGAFVASRTDRALGLEALLRPLAPGLVAARRSLIANG